MPASVCRERERARERVRIHDGSLDAMVQTNFESCCVKCHWLAKHVNAKVTLKPEFAYAPRRNVHSSCVLNRSIVVRVPATACFRT